MHSHSIKSVNSLKSLFVIGLTLLVVGCSSSARKDVPLSIYSDPLGAYALLKVDYSDQRDSDWIFLGATPVKISKSIDFEKAKKVSLRVIRENFADQTKSWSAKEFNKLRRNDNKVFWSPSMVKN